MSTSFFRKRKKTLVVAIAVLAGLALVGSTLIGAGGGILSAIRGEDIPGGKGKVSEEEIAREIENFQEQVDKDPEDVYNWLNLGNLKVHAGNYYFEAGEEEKAMDYFEKARDAFGGALEVEEENEEALVSKSLVSLYLNELDAAKENIEKAYEIAPENPEALEVYSFVNLQRGEMEESLDKLEEILEIEDLPEEDRSYYEEQLEQQKQMIDQFEKEMEKMEEMKELDEEMEVDKEEDKREE